MIKVVKERITEYDMRVEVYPYGSRQNGAITVSRNRKFGSKTMGPATINWFASGAQDVATTATFAKALLKAVEVARKLNRMKG